MAWSSEARKTRLAAAAEREQERRDEIDSQVVTCVCAYCGAQLTAELCVTRQWFRDHFDEAAGGRCRKVRSLCKVLRSLA